jgi:hypothetical protein
MEWRRPAPILIEVVILIILSVASEGRVIDFVQGPQLPQQSWFRPPLLMLNYLVLLFANMNSARRCAGSPFMFGKAGIPMLPF